MRDQNVHGFDGRDHEPQGLADGDGVTVRPDQLAYWDQQDAAVRALVASIVAHWAECPATPQRTCLGPVVNELHDMAHTNPCMTSALLQGALALLAKSDVDVRHG